MGRPVILQSAQLPRPQLAQQQPICQDQPQGSIKPEQSPTPPQRPIRRYLPPGLIRQEQPQNPHELQNLMTLLGLPSELPNDFIDDKNSADPTSPLAAGFSSDPDSRSPSPAGPKQDPNARESQANGLTRTSSNSSFEYHSCDEDAFNKASLENSSLDSPRTGPVDGIVNATPTLLPATAPSLTAAVPIKNPESTSAAAGPSQAVDAKANVVQSQPLLKKSLSRPGWVTRVSTAVNKVVSKIWRKLEIRSSPAESAYLTTEQLPSSKEGDRNIRCLKEKCVEVVRTDTNGEAVKHFIHANEIDLSSTPKELEANISVAATAPSVESKPIATPITYIAGQSPRSRLDFQNYVINAIKSMEAGNGNGIYQFCTPQVLDAAKNPTLSKETLLEFQDPPIIFRLMTALGAHKKDGADYVIGDYQITDCSFVKPDGSANNAQPKDCAHLTLTCINRTTQQQITVPFTLAGLPMEKAIDANNIKLIDANNIKQADAIYKPHVALSAVVRAGNPATPGPAQPSTPAKSMIVSSAGVGRNAALITYRELSSSIKRGEIRTAEQLNKALEDLIDKARNSRDGFVHSDLQLEQIYIALENKLKEYSNKKPANNSPSDPRLRNTTQGQAVSQLKRNNLPSAAVTDNTKNTFHSGYPGTEARPAQVDSQPENNALPPPTDINNTENVSQSTTRTSNLRTPTQERWVQIKQECERIFRVCQKSSKIFFDDVHKSTPNESSGTSAIDKAVPPNTDQGNNSLENFWDENELLVLNTSSSNNNCCIHAILMHVTGNYDGRAHDDAGNIFKEELIRLSDNGEIKDKVTRASETIEMDPALNTSMLRVNKNSDSFQRLIKLIKSEYPNHPDFEVREVQMKEHRLPVFSELSPISNNKIPFLLLNQHGIHFEPIVSPKLIELMQFE